MILLVEEILSHYQRKNDARGYVRVDGEIEDLSPPK